MKGPRFGIERVNKRYSTPSGFQGNKLSTGNMNKTLRLKFKKVEEIRSSRSEM